MNDNEILEVVNKYYKEGYKTLQSNNLWVTSSSYFGAIDYKNELFIYLKKYSKNYDSKKKQIRNYLYDFIFRIINRDLIMKQRIYKCKNYDVLKKKIKNKEEIGIKFSELDLIIENHKDSNNHNEPNKEAFYRNALRFIIDLSLEQKWRSISEEDMLTIQMLDDYLNGGFYLEDCNSQVNKRIKQRLRTMLNNMGYNSIEDLPVSLV